MLLNIFLSFVVIFLYYIDLTELAKKVNGFTFLDFLL